MAGTDPQDGGQGDQGSPGQWIARSWSHGLQRWSHVAIVASTPITRQDGRGFVPIEWSHRLDSGLFLCRAGLGPLLVGVSTPEQVNQALSATSPNQFSEQLRLVHTLPRAGHEAREATQQGRGGALAGAAGPPAPFGAAIAPAGFQRPGFGSAAAGTGRPRDSRRLGASLGMM